MSAFAGGLAVVVNVHTDAAAALALASIAEHAPGMPKRLINCEPSDASRAFFAGLVDRFSFETVEQPIRTHGETLDILFDEVPADIVLLVDSDAEILDPGVVPHLWSYFDHPLVFGAGWIDGPSWMGPRVGATPTPGAAYFQERPYMPCVMLRTAMVRQALRLGRSFGVRKVWNDVPLSPKLGSLLAARFQDDFVPRSSKIARLPRRVRERMRTWRFDQLRWIRRDYNGHRPNYVLYDTGADLYEWCKYEKGLIFAGVDQRLCTEVAHGGGLTRVVLGDPFASVDADEVDAASRQRLADHYGIKITLPTPAG